MRTREKPPVRIVHLGLGAFHRAHQAAYTDAVDDEREWGIAAFTVRSPDAAVALQAQDGVYTLVERSESGDEFRQIESIVEAHDGADVATLRDLVARPTTAIVTLTVTEAGYSPDLTDDVERLRTGIDPVTVPGRLVGALRARIANNSGPIAVVSCDNLPSNGDVTRAIVLETARRVSTALAASIDASTSFVSTSVDRITPRTTPADIEAVQAAGLDDAVPVVTEPFTNWVLRGEFPAGRPAWERAGASFVDELEPYERRKLWLLNGAHSRLAYEGILKGHATIAEAIADVAVDDLWDEASRHLSLDVDEYRAALLERFRNPRIAHHLRQIAVDGVAKLRVRAVPVIAAERAEGRDGAAAARTIAAWIAFVRANEPVDSESAAIENAHGDTRALVHLLDPTLGGDIIDTITRELDEL